jgi:hypothetical protein
MSALLEVGDAKGPREAIGGGERETNQFFLQELAYVPSSNPKTKTQEEGDGHTNQQRRNDPLEVINATEKE